MISVLSPFAGEVAKLEDISDPVFSQFLLGPGLALRPESANDVSVYSPVDATVVTVMDHAIALQIKGSTQTLLVHLGLETSGLNTSELSALVQVGQEVQAGQEILRWSPQKLKTAGIDCVSPIVLLEGAAENFTSTVTAGDKVSVQQEIAQITGLD